MSSTILFLLLHIGTIAKDLKDVEQLIADLFAKKPVGDDLKKVIDDAAALFSSGMIPCPPGMTQAEVAQAFQEIKSVMFPVPAAPAVS